MISAPKLANAFALSTALLAVSAVLASSQLAFAQGLNVNPSPVTHSSGPILAASGETVLVCAANNQPAPAPAPAPAALSTDATTAPLNVTLQILNGVTGAILSQAQLAVPPLGSTATPPDPCVNYVVPAATFAPSSNLFIVRVLLNPQPLPPGLCRAHALSVSLQVFTPDPSGSPTNIRTIAFEPPDPCIRLLP